MLEALETRHYVSATGEYLGGFGGVRRTMTAPDPETGEPVTTIIDEWPPLPAGAVETPGPPASALDLWAGGRWVAPAPAVIAAAKTQQAADLISGTPVIAALIGALAGRLSIPPAALLADVVAKLASK